MPNNASFDSRQKKNLLFVISDLSFAIEKSADFPTRSKGAIN
jgi:hypothetical protein